jgi:hypothetical protein
MPRGPKGEKRRVEFERRAFELAATGRYSDYLGIEAELSGKYPEARGWLDRGGFRDDLSRACVDAKKGQQNA